MSRPVGMQEQTDENHEAHERPTEWCSEWFCGGWILLHDAVSVTEEIIEAFESWTDTMDRIDWEWLWDKMEGSFHPDAKRRMTFGIEDDNPAMRKIQRQIRARRLT